ncbi:glycosyltransferase [Piscinibacter terrae]|uniref:Colanic acid biosynthesis glycosyltransferase WcaL n=1 Tax=Piscinibacter terrae TaxID=2496871 RepID=A0A3N7HVJ7_9BURK|nr:glycosyltransferase [Albitalea terrae]RQP26344.1 colanic acid biosynthesis glycosyltransferase WcaL [Albitalea terrae]
MRVAYLVNQYPAVSHTFIRREIHALERLGVQVDRIALRGWELTLVDPLDIEERGKTRYVLQGGPLRLLGTMFKAAVSTPGAFLRGWKLAWAMSRGAEKSWPVHLAYLAEACVIRQWLAHSGATHLHAHFATNPAEVAMLVRAIGGPAYSFTAHGSDIMDRPAQVGLQQTVGRAAFAIAVCSYGRSQIFKWIAQPLWDRVHVVRCGLERGYGDAAAAVQGATRRLVCVGRLSKEKGQLLLLKAAAQARSLSTQPFEIVLAGDGPQRAEVEALVESLDLRDCVRITGWLDAAGVQKELAQASALVVPSLSEGLPVVIMEAMASSRPVIAPYLAGIPELVLHERTGWLFPASDVQALAQAIASCLATDVSTLADLGRAGRERVWQMHDVDTEARRLKDLMAA